MVKIYGLIEDNDFLIMGMPVGQINQEHPDLWQVVEQTKQSKVGIELQTIPSIPIPPKVTFKMHEIYRTLEARLQQENQVFNIDDDAIFEEFVKIMIDLAKKRSQMSFYKKVAKAEYLYFVERDKKMLAKITAENPDVVFIGAAHAYYAHLQEAGHQIFVEAPINLREVQLEMEMNFHYSYNQEMFDTSMKNAPPLIYKLFNLSEEIDRFKDEMTKIENHALLCERRYNILKHKKVELIEKKPDYVGSWSVDANWQKLPVEGFFEVYITTQDGDTATGIIKDVLGFANFKGKFTNKAVVLEKTYFDASEFAGRGDIIYLGSGADFCYSGKYEVEHSTGSFLLVKYKPGIEKTIIRAVSSKSLLEKILEGGVPIFPNS